jgi:hypothetical protein
MIAFPPYRKVIFVDARARTAVDFDRPEAAPAAEMTQGTR